MARKCPVLWREWVCSSATQLENVLPKFALALNISIGILLSALNQVLQIQVPLSFLLAPWDSNYGGRGNEAQPSQFFFGLKNTL